LGYSSTGTTQEQATPESLTTLDITTSSDHPICLNGAFGTYTQKLKYTAGICFAYYWLSESNEFSLQISNSFLLKAFQGTRWAQKPVTNEVTLPKTNISFWETLVSGANCWFQGGIRSIWVGSGPHVLPGTGVEAPEDAELQGLSYGGSFSTMLREKTQSFTMF